MKRNFVLDFFWVCFAISAPLFGMPAFRVVVNPLNMPTPLQGAIPMFILFVIAVLGCVRSLFFVRTGKPWTIPRRYFVLIVAAFGFFGLHALGVLRSTQDMSFGFAEIIKLATGWICLWAILIFFPRDPRCLETFFLISIWSSALLLGYLIYQYGVVFAISYMGVVTEEAATASRNAMSWFVSIVFFYALASFMQSWKNKMLSAVPLVVITIALIYLGSRAAWLSVITGIVFCLGLFLTYSGIRGLRIVVITLVMTTLLVILSYLFLSQYIDMSEIRDRFTEMISLDSYSSGKVTSQQIRINYIQEAWRGFLTSPLLGVGFATSYKDLQMFTHNDYILILFELGVAGAVFFLAMFGVVVQSIIRCAPRGKYFPWIYFAMAGSFAALHAQLAFINVYTSVQFWIYFAFCLVAIDIIENQSADLT